MASGLGILFGVLPRVAAWAEAGQITLYTLLVWLPAIFATPRARLPWTALWISWTIGAAAWVVAQNTTPKSGLEAGNERQTNRRSTDCGRSGWLPPGLASLRD